MGENEKLERGQNCGMKCTAACKLTALELIRNFQLKKIILIYSSRMLFWILDTMLWKYFSTGALYWLSSLVSCELLGSVTES